LLYRLYWIPLIGNKNKRCFDVSDFFVSKVYMKRKKGEGEKDEDGDTDGDMKRMKCKDSEKEEAVKEAGLQ
jgi:hypothetical protein